MWPGAVMVNNSLDHFLLLVQLPLPLIHPSLLCASASTLLCAACALLSLATTSRMHPLAPLLFFHRSPNSPPPLSRANSSLERGAVASIPARTWSLPPATAWRGLTTTQRRPETRNMTCNGPCALVISRRRHQLCQVCPCNGEMEPAIASKQIHRCSTRVRGRILTPGVEH
jgi:hypothetical protein